MPITLQVGDLIEFANASLLPLRVPLFKHWAVYVGNGEIVHFKKDDENPIIVQELLSCYLETCGSSVSYKKKSLGLLNGVLHDPCFSGTEVAERAKSYVGTEGYHLVFNNCEHFAKWCKYDTVICEQVENKVEKGMIVGGAVVGTTIGVIAGPPGMVAGLIVGSALGTTAAFGHWAVTSIGRVLVKGDNY